MLRSRKAGRSSRGAFFVLWSFPRRLDAFGVKGEKSSLKCCRGVWLWRGETEVGWMLDVVTMASSFHSTEVMA